MTFSNRYTTKYFACSLSRTRLAFTLLTCLLACALTNTARAQALQQVVQQFFVPFPETDFQISLKAIDTTGTPVGPDLKSIVSISVGTTNTVIIYDHWEDGYENDINNSIQSSTQIWGDGNTNNGVAPGYPNDLLLPGNVIVLTNIVSLPRNPSLLKYDGRDRIAATKAVTVTRAAWALNPGTVLMSGTEVYDTTRWGTFFNIPVGTNVSPAIQSFSYSSLHIIASQNGTTVQVDTNGDGTIDRTTTLNTGDSYFVNGGVSASATVTASKPVQVHQLTGRIGSTYQSRTFAIRPFNQWDTSYYAPVGTILSSEVHDVFVYNPYPTNLTVLYATKIGTGALSVPPKNNFKFAMPLNSGAHFYTTNGLPFYAVGANDAGGTNTSNNTHDWGYALLPEAALTPLIVVGWAPGSDDLTASPAGPDANGSPVWITPTKAATIYVNYSGNYTIGPNTAPNGQHYDVSYSLAAYQFQTIYNPTTRNMTGARIFTTDGTTFAAAWGEDASKAGCCSPYFDAGHTIIPFPVPKIIKTSRVAVDQNGDGLAGWGDTLEYNIHVQNEGMLALGNVLVLDGLPSAISYVPNTTAVNGTPVADNLVPPRNTAFPLDENGLLLPQILVGGFSDIKFRVTINNGTTGITNTVSAEGAGDPVSSTEAVPVVPSTNTAPAVTITFAAASGSPVSSYITNSGIYVKLTDSAQNINVSTIQTLTVTVTNLSNGDAEQVTLTETGVNTGIFLNTTALPSSVTLGGATHDGTLLGLAGNNLSVSYTDPITLNSGSAQATITAAPLPGVTKRSQLITDQNGDGRIGWNDIVEYTIVVTNSSGVIITNPVVKDALPANVTYVAGSATTNAIIIADSGSTPFPLDESGFQLSNIPVNGAATVKFRVTVSSGTSISNSVLVTTANGSVQAQDVASVLPPPPSCNLSFSDAVGNSVISYAQNSGLYATLSDTSLNTDPATVQTITLLVKNLSNGDVEFVTLTETGTNTSVFRNTTALPSSTTTGSSTQDGTLYAQPGQNLQVDHTGALGESCSATASIAHAVEIKKLYLSDTNQILDRLDPVATGDATTTNTATLGTAGTGGPAAITVDAISRNGAAGTANSLSIPHTTGAGQNRLMLVGVGFGQQSTGLGGATVTAVTYGAQTLTKLTSIQDTGGTPRSRTEIWYLLNPSSGSNNVTISLSAAKNVAAGVVTFTEVNQTTPLGTPATSQDGTGNSTTVSLVVGSALGELIFNAAGVDGDGNALTITPGAAQINLWTTNSANQTHSIASTKAGAASVTNTWTFAGGQQWSSAGVSIKPAAITLDAFSSARANASTLTFAQTNGNGANRLLLVGVSTDNSTAVSSITYGGINLTNVGGATTSGNPKPRAEIWSLPNPPTGSNNVIVTLSGSANVVAGAATFTGVSQTTPLGTFAGNSSSSGSPSVSVSSASGEVVFDTVSIGSTATVGTGQTQIWNRTQTIFGSASTKPGTNSVTMAWTVNDKWAIGAVPIKPATSSGSGGGTTSVSFSQAPSMCKTFTLPAGQTIAVTNYVQVISGSLSATPNVTAMLQYGTTTFATLTNPVYNSGSGTLGWTATLATNVTVSAGQGITLWVTNNEAAVNFAIQYDSATKPSAISLPTTTVINIDQLNLYDAPYPAGNLLSSAFNGQTVYVRASVSDPFGSYDVNKLNLSIMDPGSNFLNVTLTNSSAVADDGCIKTYEYAWIADSFQGVHNIQAVAYEGTEGITNAAGTSILVAFPDGGTPSVTTFIDALSNPTNSYNANQTVCVRVADANMNQNPTTIETITVVITTSSNDRETVTLSETSTNSGVFTGCISANTSATVQNNGTLNAPAGSALTATYTDPTNPLDVSSDNAIVKAAASGNPVISLFKTLVDPANGNVLLGSTVQFNIQVANAGSVTVTNVKLTDTFPTAHLQFVNASLSPDSNTPPGTLTWINVGPLSPGQTLTISTFFTALSAGPLTNSVSVSGTTNIGPVTVSATNISPALSVTKTLVSPVSGPACINDSVVYRIAITNVGNTTVTNWPLSDQFSASCFQFLGASVTPSGSGGGALLWTGFPPLAAGASTNIYVTNKVTGSCSPALNSADISFGVDQFGNEVPPVQSTASITNIGANIGGNIWYDANINSTNDAGDSALFNVIAFIDLNNDGVRQPIEPFTLTATNGQYEITSLAASNYVVRVDTNTLPAGVQPTYDLDGTNTANVASVTVTNGQSITNADFGYVGSGSINGYLWNDVNGDGIKQAAEPLLSNIKVFVDLNGNGVRESGEQFVLTGADGTYQISNLISNTYIVAVDLSSLPTGVHSTFDADGIATPDAASVILGADQNSANINFGYQGSASLSGLVTDIFTGQPIAAATVSVTDSLGVVQTATTDLTGIYNISSLWVGNTTVTVSKTGYIATNSTPVIVTGANTVNEQLTPNTLTGLVTDAVTGQPIIGATVRVVDNTSVTNTVTTDVTGHYGVTNVAAGPAIITGTKTGYSPAMATPTIVPGNNTQNLSLTANTLSGQVTDAFTSQPVVGATVQVIDNASVTNTLTTDATGHYSVTNIAAGLATITASKTGYVTSIITPTIVAGPNTQNLVLTPNTLTGVVTDAATSQFIAGATVRVVDLAGVTNILVTDAAGHYGVTNIAVGAATVTASKTGYFPTNAAPTIISGNNTLNLQLTLVPQADMVTTSSGPASVASGVTFAYTITLTNLGPATASNVVASDALPATGTFVSATGGGTNNSGVITWPAIDLASGGTTNFTVTFTAPASGILTNIASSTAATGDPDPTNNNGSALAAKVITTVASQADIAVLKTGSSTVLAGGNLTYKITVTNLGPSTASNVMVSDNLPLSATFVSATGGGLLSGNTVNWPAITSLANGGVTTFTVTVTAPASGSITNTASASSTTGDPVPSNNDGSSAASVVVTTVTPQADIAVLKTGSDTVLAGSNLTYTITITNLGPSTASNILVSDTLPLSVTFVSASNGGVVEGNLVNWPAITSLTNGGTTTFTVSVKAPASGSFTNTAAAFSPTSDPVSTNNNGSAAASMVVTTVTPQADIAVLKTGSLTVLAGGNLTYTITVTNLGPSTASNVVVSDNLPLNVTFVSATGGGLLSGNVVNWPAITSLTNGGVTSFTVTAKAPSSGSITNTASASSTTGDPVPSNNDGSSAASVVVTTVTPQADLAVIKTGSSTVLAGGNLTYTITVTNLGPSMASNVVVSDNLPLSAAFVSATGGGLLSGSTVSWPTITSLTNGAVTSFTVTVKAPSSGSITNSASASSTTGDPVPSNNDGSSAASVVVTTVTPQADLAVIKTGSLTVLAGGNLTYTITVTNLGPSTASNVVVSDNLPLSVIFVSASNGGISTGNVVNWPVITSLANGAGTTFTVTVKAPASGSITNTASATSSTSDPIPSNNDGSSISSVVITTVMPQADIAVLKTGFSTVLAGGNLTYTITVTNLGPSTASNVVVSDSLPGSVTFVSATGGGLLSGNMVNWPTITSLINDGVATFTVTVKAPATGSFTNSASATASTGDPISTNNDGSSAASVVVTTVTPQADIALLKTGNATVLAGNNLTYTITVTNLGPSTASNIVVSDSLPLSVTFVSVTGGGLLTGNVVNWPAITSLTNGGTTSFTVTVKAPASGSITNTASASSTTGDPVPTNNDGSSAASVVVTTVTPQADIAVLKTGSATVLADSNLTYTITVTNLGPSTASNVVVSDTLPLSVTLVSATGGGLLSGNAVNWPAIASLTNGAVTSFMVTVKAPASGSFTNTASAASTTGDPVPSNNDGSSAGSVVVTTVTPQADIAVLKTGSSTVLAGGNLTYTITITNLGPSTASNVVVSDNLPLNVTFVSATGGGLLSGNVVNWPAITSLTNGGVTSFTVTAKAPSSGSIANSASATASTGDPVSTNNDGSSVASVVVTTVTPQADIAVLKTGSSTVLAGGNLTYTITVTNLGPSTASNVVVSDNLPLSATFVSATGGGFLSGNTVNWPTITSLTNGGMSSFTVTVKAPASGSMTNSASASSTTGDPVPTNNDGSSAASVVVTTVTPQADLAVIKTGSFTVLAGGNLNYTITVTNLGPSTASNVVVSDSLPGTVTFVSATGGGLLSGNTVNWPAITSLANGGVTTFTVTVTAPASGSITNTASASSTTGDPVPSNNDGSSAASVVVTTVTPQADIAVLKTGSLSVLAGGNLTYTITVTNLGPSAASNVVVSDGLPLSVTFVSATGGGLLSGNTVSWPAITSLANGGVSSFTVTVKAPVSGSITNSASATSSTGDPVPANNNGSSAASVAVTTVTPQADLAVLKSGSATVLAGGNLTYTITVTNLGPSTASNVVVSDNLPLNVTFVSASNGGLLTGNVVNWAAITSLANGAVTSFTVTVKAPANGSITNSANATSSTGDPVSANNNGSSAASVVVTTVTPQADVAVLKTGSATVLAGDNLTYTIMVTNLGPSAASNVVVSDNLPSTVTFVSATSGGLLNGNVVNWPAITSLANGGVTTFTVTVKAPASGSITNTASTTSSTGDPVPTNNDGSSAASVVVTTVTPQADIAVIKTGSSTVLAGGNLTYTITVTNLGPSTASNVVVSDSLPLSAIFVGASSGGLLSANAVIWPTITSLTNGGASSFTVTVKAPASGSITNTASATSSTGDPVFSNNDGSSAASVVVTTVTPQADLAVIKTGSGSVLAGGNLTYTITVTNLGPSTASNVVVSDSLPGVLTFVSASNGGLLTGNVVNWPPVTSLTNGGTTNFTITVKTPASGSFTNIASATSTTGDPVPGNNDGSTPGSKVTTSVTPQADVAVFKTGADTVLPGANFTYTITVTNLGPSTAANVVAIDNLPTNLTFVSASGGAAFSNNVVTWPAIASLIKGASTNFTITVKAPISGSFTNKASATSSTLDPVNSNNDGTSPGSQVNTSISTGQFGILAGPNVFNPQTGLYEERVTVTNLSATTAAALRLYVGGLRTGVQLHNATGTNSGRPYIQYNAPLNPNQTVVLLLEFFVPDRRPFTNTLEVEAVLPASSGTNSGNGLTITRVFVDSRIADDPRLVIEFPSITGRTYTVIYSDDNLQTWKAATPSITASANVTQWYDDGPPKTDSKPLSGPSRFYRVIVAPAKP